LLRSRSSSGAAIRRVNGSGRHFFFTLPPIVPDRAVVDNWQTSAWMRRVRGIGRLPATEGRDEHFD
jgi:hypothetical protein